jgi:hypothetical protein
MINWLIASVVLTAFWFVWDVQQPMLLLWKANLAVVGGYLGYRLDTGLFHYARPHALLAQGEAMRCLCADATDPFEVERLQAVVDDWVGQAMVATVRRAIIIATCVLGLTLGG